MALNLPKNQKHLQTLAENLDYAAIFPVLPPPMFRGVYRDDGLMDYDPDGIIAAHVNLDSWGIPVDVDHLECEHAGRIVSLFKDDTGGISGLASISKLAYDALKKNTYASVSPVFTYKVPEFEANSEGGVNKVIRVTSLALTDSPNLMFNQKISLNNTKSEQQNINYATISYTSSNSMTPNKDFKMKVLLDILSKLGESINSELLDSEDKMLSVINAKIDALKETEAKAVELISKNTELSAENAAFKKAAEATAKLEKIKEAKNSFVALIDTAVKEFKITDEMAISFKTSVNTASDDLVEATIASTSALIKNLPVSQLLKAKKAEESISANTAVIAEKLGDPSKESVVVQSRTRAF